MNKNQQRNITLVICGVIILLVVFFVGNYMGEKAGEKNALAGVPGIPAGINVTSDQFAPFWKVWQLISDKYVAATTTDSQQRVWGAIQGLAQSQGDPYTVFFPPAQNDQFKTDIAGDFEGVGMEIGLKDTSLTVIAPLKDSPAAKAGVQSGDIVTKINGQDVTGMTEDQAVALIRGPKGTAVTIDFLRAGSVLPIEKKIVRDTINIPTIQTEEKSGDVNASSSADVAEGTGLQSDGVYVIRLFTFTAQAPDLFRSALRNFVQSGSHKLIIDLRGNPGGYLDAAWDMASWFLPAGQVVVTEDFGGKVPSQVYRSKGYNIFGKSLDLVILVDSGSASASEIFAGALHEHGVAKLVGQKTFGKGSVQELIPITDDTSLKVTIARWLTPDGHNLSHDGLDPDVVVPITQADIDSKNDAQMNAAVDILRKEQ